ncbi:PAS domain-containing protein, partial [Planomicrobium okeanokoites]|uniref:PAS domain-containing protein n=1 Tax=Planomicrobium okeanokoites TaxID=244 RepID=UPI0035691A59
MENYYIENIDQDFLASTALLDIIEDPVFLMKEEQGSFKYMYANPAALTVLDLTEIKGLQIGEYLPPKLCRQLMPHYRMVQSTRKSVEFTERIQTVNGGFIGETKLNPIVSKDGRCLYVLAIVRDVTERERKKQELLDTQREMEIERKRLSSLVNNNANPVFEFDQHQRFISLNKIVAEATGFSEEELLGSSILSLVADHCLDEARLNVEKALKGQALDFEVSIYTKSRQIEVLHLNTIPIIIEENVIGVYAIAKAITKQKEMGRLLLESEQRYKSLFENHPHGIMTFDKAGNLSSINKRIESITGHNLTELG